MRIAFVINVFREKDFRSGGEKFFFELVNKAIADNHHVDLYCSKYISDSGKPELAGLNKITVLGNSRLYKHPEKVEKLYKEIRNYLDKESYDFVLAENITPSLDIALLQGHSAIHYQKNISNILSKILFGIKKYKHIKYQEKWLNQGYRKIFAVSNILKNDIMTNFNIPEDRISVIYPGIDMPEITAERAFNKNNQIIFGLSAPSFRNKGGYIFLKALHILKKQNYKFKAKIIYPKSGKNLALMFLVKIFGLEKYIDFLPYQNNMQSFYDSVDCVVMPSIVETFGLVALEAMANKKPCIVSSCSGVSEIIDDGVNGFVFIMDRHASENLAQKMAFIINNADKSSEYPQNAYETAKIYSWKKTCGELIKELLELR